MPQNAYVVAKGDACPRMSTFSTEPPLQATVPGTSPWGDGALVDRRIEDTTVRSCASLVPTSYGSCGHGRSVTGGRCAALRGAWPSTGADSFSCSFYTGGALFTGVSGHDWVLSTSRVKPRGH